MTSGQPQVILILGQDIGLLLILLLPCLGGLVVLLREKRRRRATAPPDWTLPPLDGSAEGTSLFHTWSPAVKIGALLITAFLLAALTTLFWSALALLVALAAVHLAKIRWDRPLRRLAAMSGFLGALLVILPLTCAIRPGDTVLILPLLPALPLRLSGLILALTLILKACSVALLMEPMLATAPLARTLQGFAALGLPPALLAMVSLCHRYLFVFQQEMARMHRSMRVRGFRPTTDLATMRTMAHGLGMLFIRSFERTERVYEAMRSRGYRGTFPVTDQPRPNGSDLLKGVLWIGIGLLLLVGDRLYPTPWF
jgi:cobalt/nickel transport system permease protein